MIRRIAYAFVGLLLAIPVGGFAFGFIACQDGGWNVLGRLLVGCVMAVLTTFTGGFPPQNEGGVGEPYNAWPYIIAVWVLLMGAFFWIERRKRRMP